jgi:predicted dehydrogenase
MPQCRLAAMSDGAPGVRVAVIGVGRWTVAHHIPSVLAHPRAELVAVAEPDADRRRSVAARLGVAQFATADELLSAQLADAVVIGSPAAAHHAAAITALEAGLHVLVEKPMTIRPADAWRMVEVARARERHLVVGYTFQFTPHAARARELVAAGAIGGIELLEVSYASGMRHLYEPPEPGGQGEVALDRPAPGTFDDPAMAGGGQAASQASHAVASMLATTGLSVETVAAHTRGAGLRVDLVDAALLELSGGAVGTLTSTGNLDPSQEPQWLLRYYGSEGVLVHDLRAGTLACHDRRGRVERAPDLEPTERYPAQAPASRLVDLALGGGENPAPGELGAHAVDVVDALYRSAAAGGAPVAIHAAVDGSP